MFEMESYQGRFLGHTALSNIVWVLLLAFAWASSTVASAQSCEDMWSRLSEGINDGVAALAVFDDGSGPALYAGGPFFYAGGIEAQSIAVWDGVAWSPVNGPMGESLNGTVDALLVYDDGGGPALYVGGRFTTADTIPATSIAKWDGTDWSPVAEAGSTGLENFIYTLTVFDDGSGRALYAGGIFPDDTGTNFYGVAKWDGSAWSFVTGSGGGYVDRVVRGLASFNDGTNPYLVAYGDFLTIGGVSAPGIAKWDGAEWSPLDEVTGLSTNGHIYDVFVREEDGRDVMYLGGGFSAVGAMEANGVVTWDGASWAPLIDSGINGVDGDVNGFGVHDDGTGEALYVGGKFRFAGGKFVNRIAKWDGESWSALEGPDGTGIDGNPLTTAGSIISHDDGTGNAMYVGGFLAVAGGYCSRNIARWGCGGQVCVSDCDRNCQVDFSDYLCFQNKFALGDAAADCDGDGDLTVFDFLCFQNSFQECSTH